MSKTILVSQPGKGNRLSVFHEFTEYGTQYLCAMNTAISYDAMNYSARYKAFASIGHKIQLEELHKKICKYDEILKEADASLDIVIDYSRFQLQYKFVFSPNVPAQLRKEILIAKR